MSVESPISLGDVARVMKRLKPGDRHTWNRVLDLLGLPLEMGKSTSTSTSERQDPQAPADIDGALKLDDVDREDEEWEPPPRVPLPTFAAGDEVDIRLQGKSAPRPEWSDPGDVLTVFGDEFETKLDPLPPLFPIGQGRALLTALAIALAETGELDEERAIAKIARGEPLIEIPLRYCPTSRFGVQLLIDRGQRMQPFREDQQRLRIDLHGIIGAHRVEVLQFSGFPDSAGVGSPRTWRPFESPSAGTVVLILSDLDLGWLGDSGNSRDIDAWVAWARRVKSSGARPVALVPHGRDHWPEALQKHMILVHWDRSATVGTVRRAMGNATRARI
jgi:hypothetical protein